MNEDIRWDTVITGLSSSGMEIRTKLGRWFLASYRDGGLYVDKATDHISSCGLSMPRNITKKDFLFVASYYSRWINEEKGIRQEVSKKSENTSYIFALIDRFDQ